jgi:hypothetical protein
MNPRNLVDFLTKHDAAVLSELQTKFPSANTLWRRDRDMGSSAPATEKPLDAALRLALVGIETLRKRADAVLVELTKRLKRSEMLKTVSSSVSAVATAGLLASLTKSLGLGDSGLELTLAITAFTSSLLSIFAERAAGGANGGQVRDHFETTVALSSRILRADLKVKRIEIISVSEPQLDNLLSDLDEIALALHDVELKLRVA